jgi:uncharacterized protein with HEPN domain
MLPESRKLLEDMRDAANEIAASARTQSLESYLANRQLRWSVERGFEIIGEALTQLRKREPTIAERITDFRKIISFRNVLIHGYGGVNPETTWDIVYEDLPKLSRELEAMLKD